MSATPYKGRSVEPVHVERGEALMARWAAEDRARDLRDAVDAVGDLIEASAS